MKKTVVMAAMVLAASVAMAGGFKAPISGTFVTNSYTYTHNEDMVGIAAIDFKTAVSTNAISITSSNVTGIAITLASGTTNVLAVTDGAVARPIVKGGTIVFDASAANTNGHYYVIYLKAD